MDIPQEQLDRLTSRGLLIGGPFVPDHVAYPNGLMIGKPKSVGGNHTGHKAYFGPDEITTDAPCPIVFWNEDSWIVTVSDYAPGPGPGDFVHHHATVEYAIEEILEYFFGNHDEMKLRQAENQRKREFRKSRHGKNAT